MLFLLQRSQTPALTSYVSHFKSDQVISLMHSTHVWTTKIKEQYIIEEETTELPAVTAGVAEGGDAAKEAGPLFLCSTVYFILNHVEQECCDP